MQRTGKEFIGIFFGDVDVEFLPFVVTIVPEEQILVTGLLPRAQQ
jgi:hypothetical protein